MGRNIYLETVSIEAALEALRASLDREDLVQRIIVPVAEALGRVTAAPIYARSSCPTYHSAAMDGIAVTAKETFAAREGRPVVLEPGQFKPVNTGNVLPQGRDAVIMIEHVQELDNGRAQIEAPAFPWQHVRRIGEDIVATELIIPQHRQLTPYDLGALLSGGIFQVEVFEPVRMVVIPTGDEVLDYETQPEPKPGQVIESNSVVLSALARTQGIVPERIPPVPDDEAMLEAAVRRALDGQAHIVVIGAGSSAGSKDYTRRIMERVGRVVVHGIKAMPGKPSLLGVAANGKLLVGAPGYPVSAVVCFEQLLAPLAAWLERKPAPERPRLDVTLTRSLPSKLGMREFVRLAIGSVAVDGPEGRATRWLATPLPRGAGMITTLTKAQGVAAIPEDSEGAEAGSTLSAELFVPESELARTLVCVGSHDNTLDILANELMAEAEPVWLASTHVGSMGGIAALAKGQAMLAGAHLFDPESGDFNFPFLARYAPDVDLEVVNLAIRHQGLMVAPGNPKHIHGVADLARPDVVFINRQRGAGTRILLDHHLQVAGVDPREVRGYAKEEFTHMAVAVNVATGAADCGLGIMAAARALELDFVPLARERYDLLIPRAFLDDPKVRALLEMVRSERFRELVEKLGGYETGLTGQVMQLGQGLG